MRVRAARAVLPIPDWVTDAEFETIQMIATRMGSLPETPECPGPLLVHADGAFECHGDACPGGMVMFHSDDIVDPCSIHREIQTRHACERCRSHSDDELDSPAVRSTDSPDEVVTPIDAARRRRAGSEYPTRQT
jgi:hypothetical protein